MSERRQWLYRWPVESSKTAMDTRKLLWVLLVSGQEGVGPDSESFAAAKTKIKACSCDCYYKDITTCFSIPPCSAGNDGYSSLRRNL